MYGKFVKGTWAISFIPLIALLISGCAETTPSAQPPQTVTVTPPPQTVTVTPPPRTVTVTPPPQTVTVTPLPQPVTATPTPVKAVTQTPTTLVSTPQAKVDIVSSKGWMDSGYYRVRAFVKNTGECNATFTFGIKVYDSNNNCLTPPEDYFQTWENICVGETARVQGPFHGVRNASSFKVWIEKAKPSGVPNPITTSNVLIEKIYHTSNGTPHVVMKNNTDQNISVKYEFRLYNPDDNTLYRAYVRTTNIEPNKGIDIPIHWLGYCESLINKAYILEVR